LLVKLTDNRIRIGARLEITLERTIRVPEDTTLHYLPPSLGEFPLRDVRSLRGRVPKDWTGFVVPVYQKEALWIRFRAPRGDWTAIEPSAGGVNILTGAPARARLQAHPQNYIVCPKQLWIDGIVTAEGAVRQFVAVPLGAGLSVGEQMRLGPAPALSLTAFVPRQGTKLPRFIPETQQESVMGLGAGGAVRQKIYRDPLPKSSWDPRPAASIDIRLVNSRDWAATTGETPPPSPISARDYSDWGLPWFELYDEDEAAISSTRAFDKLRGVTGGEPGITSPPKVQPIFRKRPRR
jgi:hypothetical protein